MNSADLGKNIALHAVKRVAEKKGSKIEGGEKTKEELVLEAMKGEQRLKTKGESAVAVSQEVSSLQERVPSEVLRARETGQFVEKISDVLEEPNRMYETFAKKHPGLSRTAEVSISWGIDVALERCEEAIGFPVMTILKKIVVPLRGEERVAGAVWEKAVSVFDRAKNFAEKSK